MSRNWKWGRSHLALVLSAFVIAACEGPIGPNGTTGPAGPTGAAGADGKDGAPGKDGLPGDKGDKGDKGDTGEAGTPGEKGDKGDTGDTGPAGPAGADGEDGADAPVPTVEKCGGCHTGNIDKKHAERNHVVVSNVVVAAADPASGTPKSDLTVTFNVKVDGINRNDYTHVASLYRYTYDTAEKGGRRVEHFPLTRTGSIVANLVTPIVTQTWNGNYKVTLPGMGPAGQKPVVDKTTIMLTVDTGNSQPAATVLGNYNGKARALVRDEACMACHGDYVWHELDAATRLPAGHKGSNPKGVEGCVVCHNRIDSSEPRLGTSSVIGADGTITTTGTAPGTRLMGYVHGIHNSHNMPARTIKGTINGTEYTVEKPDGTYARSDSIRLKAGSTTEAELADAYSIGFPSYQNNCANCHDTEEGLAAVNAAPVSYKLCMSCHDSWAGFDMKNAAGAAIASHAAFTTTTNCADCHEGTVAFGTAKGAHNGLKTGRSGLIWDGQDQSVVVGKKLTMAITDVSVGGTPAKVTIKWAATYEGAAVDPCNTNVANGPIFHAGGAADTATGKVASNMSILRAYAQGDDWVNAGLGTSPGQPGSAVNLTTTNTTCASNVATTIIDAETTTATKGVLAVQGKPQVTFAPATGTKNQVIQLRAVTPVREFVPTSGALPASTRRQIVSNDKCQSCHEGSLYQHGGNRIDNVELCIMCHNPASGEKHNRVTAGVDATEAYDGKPSQTFDLRTMIHAIHSAGETNMPLVYYRTNGIYLFGSKSALAKVEGRTENKWPGSGCQLVAGSTAKMGTDCTPAPGTAAGAYKNHNFVEVHYPRALSDCAACHVDGSVDTVVDPTKGVAVTVDPGAAPWSGQIDDVLMGPTAASCMSCHQNGDFVTNFFLRGHANAGGWAPTTFPEGRKTLLDAASVMP